MAVGADDREPGADLVAARPRRGAAGARARGRQPPVVRGPPRRTQPGAPPGTVDGLAHQHLGRHQRGRRQPARRRPGPLRRRPRPGAPREGRSRPAGRCCPGLAEADAATAATTRRNGISAPVPVLLVGAVGDLDLEVGSTITVDTLNEPVRLEVHGILDAFPGAGTGPPTLVAPADSFFASQGNDDPRLRPGTGHAPQPPGRVPDLPVVRLGGRRGRDAVGPRPALGRSPGRSHRSARRRSTWPRPRPVATRSPSASSSARSGCRPSRSPPSGWHGGHRPPTGCSPGPVRGATPPAGPAPSRSPWCSR